MSRPKLKVSVKGHKRRSYVRRNGARVGRSYVDPHKREIEDKGRKGRTPKLRRWFKPEGRLDGWSIDKSEIERHRILDKVVKRDGYSVAIKRLVALRNVSTIREVDRKAKADEDYLRRKYR